MTPLEGKTIAEQYPPVCFKYQKDLQTWNYFANLGFPRIRSASALSKDSLFITGGESLNPSSPAINSTLFVYINGTVITGPEMPSPRSNHCMVTLPSGNLCIGKRFWPQNT